MEAKSPDAFLEFSKNNPVLAENKIIAFLSTEKARADRGEISAGTINNWVKAARLFLETSDVQLIFAVIAISQIIYVNSFYIRDFDLFCGQ